MSQGNVSSNNGSSQNQTSMPQGISLINANNGNFQNISANVSLTTAGVEDKTLIKTAQSIVLFSIT